jgi:hypothetical protein
METVYWICALVGGTLIVCQFVLTLLGIGGDHDVGGHDVGGHDFGGHGHDVGGHDVGGHDAAHGHADHDAKQGGHSTWFFSLLTVRTVVAGLAFFGLAGLAAREAEVEPLPALGLAVGAGFLAVFIVGTLMRSLSRLNVDGTVRIERSVGAAGTVYLKVPANREGVGKVHVSVHSRTVEYKAITSQQELPTGAKVVVVGVVSSDTVEVSPVSQMEKTAHV